MATGEISDGQISASSEYSANTAASQGRLHFKSDSKADAWEPAAKNSNQWLQVDLGNQFTKVTGMATQGRSDKYHRVTKYNLQYGNDTVTLTYYKEEGQPGNMAMVS